MTRLIADDIAAIPHNRAEYARRLRTVTGRTALELAADALEIDVDTATRTCSGLRVGVIPISSGEGLIAGFDAALAAIVRDLGMEAVLLPADAAGFALADRVDLLIWADDDRFVAENRRSGIVAENGEATGLGFAAVLHHMRRNHPVLPPETPVVVRGCGPVGRAAARNLRDRGYAVIPCDTVSARAEALAHELAAETAPLYATPASLPGVAPRIHMLLDGAPTTDHLPHSLLAPTCVVAAPGVPCPWAERLQPGQQLWHDPLETGTSVMLVAAACGRNL